MAKRTRPAVCEWCGDEFMGRDDRVPHFCSRKCCGLARRGVRAGERNPNYKGGLSFDRHSGRWKIMCRDGSQMWFYRGVMAAKLGRLLRPDEIVHHVNEVVDDDCEENLQLVTRAGHIGIHRPQIQAARVAA